MSCRKASSLRSEARALERWTCGSSPQRTAISLKPFARERSGKIFYRLNVFPIGVPPLRERGDDIVLLASAFAQKFAQRIGRSIEPPSPTCLHRLRSYDWPGNARELQNVIERAVITSRDGRLNLDRALPQHSPPARGVEAEPTQRPVRIRMADELRELERRNILLALETAKWRVSGEGGAAQLLGMNPSTLYSRIKALGIERT